MVAIQLAGGDGEPYQDMMSAIELMHVGSELVDDVEDGSAFRRGVPAAHQVFGEPLTINSGCAAYFAFDRIARTIPGIDPETRLKSMRCTARCCARPTPARPSTYSDTAPPCGRR
jgi:geranylgeranyl pyrophosphate synthase